jgi:hypothetical protein
MGTCQMVRPHIQKKIEVGADVSHSTNP